MTPGVVYDPGDWCLCVNEADGWVRIDTMTGGPGGGGASVLNDLLDVTLTGATDGQYLQLQASGQWQNVDLQAGVESVNGQTGEVVLTPADIGAATEDQGALADTALQPGDNISELNNDSGFITAADVPVVTGFVALDDGGNQQQITGGGGINLAGPFVSTIPDAVTRGVTAQGQVSQAWNAPTSYTAFAALNFNVETFSVDAMGDAYIRRSLVVGNEGGGGDAVTGELEVLGGATVQFGTSANPLGNIMPRDDWSSLPTLGDDPGPGPGPTPTPSVTLSTSSFTSGVRIGLDYRYDQQCGGQNTSPQLSWQIDDLPDGATITSWEVLLRRHHRERLRPLGRHRHPSRSNLHR